jgi:uncharacterized protein YjbI with pentapeptide repeats
VAVSRPVAEVGHVRIPFYISAVPSFSPLLLSLFLLLPLVLGSGPARAACVDSAAPGVDWRRCLQDGRDFSNTDLSGAVLRDASFVRARLIGAKLAGAEAPDVRFTSANLTGADLSRAVMRGADFTRAVLRDASLAGADLRQARFFRADMRGVDLSGAELGGADMLDVMLDGALWVDGQRRCAADSVGACR